MPTAMKVITILAAMCPSSLAADCKTHPLLCEAGFDETSLMQLRLNNKGPVITKIITKTVTTSSSSSSSSEDEGSEGGNFSLDNSSGAFAVEMAQDELKAAQSNASIQMYAQANAKYLLWKAIWAQAKAASKASGATLKEVKAERAAAAAFQTAADELDAWQAAVAANEDAQEQTDVAEADATAKHEAMKLAQAAADNATAAREAAEADAEETETVQQQIVNDAAAHVSAVYALESKEEAADARVEQKAAQAEADAMNAALKEAQANKWKSWNNARKDEWHAHWKSSKAQQAALKAAKAQVEGSLADQVAAIVGPMNLTALLQQPDTELLDNITANASAIVQAAETLVSEAASDEKKAIAAADVAKYAADKSAAKMKTMQAKADSAYAAAVKASQVAMKTAREARQADESIEEATWKLGHANAANITATYTMNAAENATYSTAESVREASDTESAAEASLEGVTAEALRNQTFEANEEADEEAQSAAEQAASSRIVSEYEEFEEEGAKAEADEANSELKAANEEYSESVHISNSAESDAAHAANQAQEWDEKSAAATLDDSVNTTAPSTPEEAADSSTEVVTSSSSMTIPA